LSGCTVGSFSRRAQTHELLSLIRVKFECYFFFKDLSVTNVDTDKDRKRIWEENLVLLAIPPST
jgi:hypothetical protein